MRNSVPRPDYKTCKGCGRSVSEVGSLSHTRLCADCGNTRRVANAVQIATKTGPFYLHAKRRQLMEAQRALLDAQRASA